MAAFEQNVALQNELGGTSRMIDVAEARRLSPLIDTDGLLAAAWSPDDGHCTPESVVLGYAGAARRAGARLVRGCSVTGIDSAGGSITAVETTPRHRSATERRRVRGGRLVGAGRRDGRRRPARSCRCVARSSRPSRSPASTRARRSRSTSRPASTSTARGRACCSACPTPTRRPGFKLGRSDDWLPRLGEAIERRAPAIAEVGIASGWAGLYEMTPDHNALVGEAPDVSRFLYATGFSGHGFLMGPAIGEVMRDLYLGATPVVDVSGLDARPVPRARRPPRAQHRLTTPKEQP